MLCGFHARGVNGRYYHAIRNRSDETDPDLLCRISTFARHKQFLAGMGLPWDETLATIDHMFN